MTQKKVSKKKIRKVEKKIQNLPATPQTFLYMGLYRLLTELHYQGDYILVSQICDAVLNYF